MTKKNVSSLLSCETKRVGFGHRDPVRKSGESPENISSPRQKKFSSLELIWGAAVRDVQTGIIWPVGKIFLVGRGTGEVVRPEAVRPFKNLPGRQSGLLVALMCHCV